MASRPNNGEGRKPLPDTQRAAEIAEAVANVREMRAEVAAKVGRSREVAQIILNWWENELASFGGSPDDPVLEHAGVIYAGTVGRA